MTRSAESPHPAITPDAPRRQPRHRLKKAVIHLFVGFHLTAVVCWSLSSPHSTASLNRKVRSRLAPYMVPMRFTQQWDMFAPNPNLSNNYLEAEVTFADGGRATWPFPRVDRMGYFERYRKERHRKWATERVLAAGKPNPVVAEAAAAFAARQVGRPGNPPRKVELVRYRSQIPAPRRGQLRPHSEAPTEWDRQLLYTCEFDEGGRVSRAWAATQPAATQPGATQPAEAAPLSTQPADAPVKEPAARDGGGE